MDKYSKEIKEKEKDCSPQKEPDEHQRLKEKTKPNNKNSEHIIAVELPRICGCVTVIWNEFVEEVNAISMRGRQKEQLAKPTRNELSVRKALVGDEEPSYH